MDHLAVHIGQPKIATGVAVSQLLVVDAEHVEEGGVEVMDGDAVVDGAETELVGGA